VTDAAQQSIPQDPSERTSQALPRQLEFGRQAAQFRLHGREVTVCAGAAGHDDHIDLGAPIDALDRFPDQSLGPVALHGAPDPTRRDDGDPYGMIRQAGAPMHAQEAATALVAPLKDGRDVATVP